MSLLHRWFDYAQCPPQEFVKPFVLSFITSSHSKPATFREVVRKAWLEKRLTQRKSAGSVGLNGMTVVNWGTVRDGPPHSSGQVQFVVQYSVGRQVNSAASVSALRVSLEALSIGCQSRCQCGH